MADGKLYGLAPAGTEVHLFLLKGLHTVDYHFNVYAIFPVYSSLPPRIHTSVPAICI